MIKFIKKKINIIDKTRSYHVVVPRDVDSELIATLRDLGLTEEEIRVALKSRNINS